MISTLLHLLRLFLFLCGGHRQLALEPFPITGAAVELTEAEVAMGRKLTHFERVRHCESLAVTRFGLLRSGRRALGRNVAEESERVPDLALRSALAGDLEGVTAEAGGLIEPVEREIRHGQEVSESGLRNIGMFLKLETETLTKFEWWLQGDTPPARSWPGSTWCYRPTPR